MITGNLRPSLFVLLVGSISAASLGVSQYLLASASDDWQNAQQQLLNAQRTLAHLHSAHSALPGQAALYRTLQQRHVIGNLAPDLPNLVREHESHALTVRANFAPAQNMPMATTEHFRVRQYPVHMQIEALHEEKLLDFLAGLRSEGWFMLEHCSVEAAENSLHAECAGGWLTVEPNDIPG